MNANKKLWLSLFVPFLLTMTLFASSERGRIIEGELVNGGSVDSPPGIKGVCRWQEWHCPTSLGNHGGCKKIIFMLDVKDERLFRVGTKANIYLLNLTYPNRKPRLMGSIGEHASGIGFQFDPKNCEEYVKWSNGKVKFLIELAPGGVRITNGRCRYGFAE